LGFRANIPPSIDKKVRKVTQADRAGDRGRTSLGKERSEKSPTVQVALKNVSKQLQAVLSRWETAYNKEKFYRGIRIFLGRKGPSKL